MPPKPTPQTSSSTSTDPGPLDSFVGVEISYQDLAGRPRRARSFGDDVVDLQLDEVQGNIVATHQVFFDHAPPIARRPGTTSPKLAPDLSRSQRPVSRLSCSWR